MSEQHVPSQDGLPAADVWSVPGVEGRVSLLIVGDVVVLHTGSERQDLDGLLGGRAFGRPLEMSKGQLRDLARLIFRVTTEADDQPPDDQP